MFGKLPIRMNYAPATGKQDVTVVVDVYDFTIIEQEHAVALCWFVSDKEWHVVDIEQLLPIQQKTLNE